MLAENKVKTIGVMTSGGDAPGMNAAIRAVVYEGIRHGLKVLGIRRGYSGLLQEDIREIDEKSVADIIRLGGTILETSRCPEMMTDEGQAKAVEICRKHQMDGLIVIGGDGSFRGAQKLSARGMGIIGVPGTIDGDIACTDYTIGFDTAVNAAMEAIDRIHDTGASHECCSIVEVMGRHNGSIALWTGIAGGAEMVCIPERKVPTVNEIAEDVLSKRRQGRNDYILVNAEGVGHTQELRQAMEEDTGIHTRQTVLGFLQRGGVPTCKERVFASVMGTKAVDLLLEGRTNRVVVHRDGRFSDVSIDEVLTQEVYFADDLYQCMKAVCGQGN
ncbi:MAG: ATP-dependent 6-phosphofructokinase [Bilifractor sp.]|jgi:6-phosphofructokinase 1